MPEILPSQHEALMRADAPKTAIVPRDPNREPDGKFAVGNRLNIGTVRGRQKISNACYQRALEFMSGDVEPQEGDENNPLIQIMKIARDTKDPELALKAWDKCCRYIFGTKSNLNLEVGEAVEGDAERGSRMLIALERLRK